VPENSLEKILLGRSFSRKDANKQFKITNVEWIPRPTQLQRATGTTTEGSSVPQVASTSKPQHKTPIVFEADSEVHQPPAARQLFQ